MTGMYWRNSYGQELKVKKMGNNYILNCLRLMEKKGQENSPMWFYMNGILDGRKTVINDSLKENKNIMLGLNEK